MERSIKSLGLLAPLLLSGCGGYTINPYATDAPTRVPRISILTPAKQGEVAGEFFTISVGFKEVLVDDIWTLSYVSNATAKKGAHIAENLPVTARRIDWDTTQLPNGTYFIYGELTSLNGIFTTSAPGSIVVAHGVATGNSPPAVRITSPNGGETYAAGTTVAVNWNATDADADGLTYKLELSADSGNTWTSLVEGLSSTSYNWVIAADQPHGLFYRLRVTAEDPKTASTSDVSDEVFSIE